jgi:hypothetical protein
MTRNDMIAYTHVRTSGAGEFVVLEKDPSEYSTVYSDGRKHYYDLRADDCSLDDFIVFVECAWELTDDVDCFFEETENGTFRATM